MAGAILLTASPQCILIGGGVGIGRAFLLGRAQDILVERMAGYLPATTSAQHVGFGQVLGPDGKKFSTREGSAVTLNSLLDEADQHAAPAIALAAIKYADLSSGLQKDYSFDIEQTLGIGSQSTGAGAGKVTFNPFSITRKVDKSSPIFFQNACSGKAFKSVFLGMRKSAGNDATGVFFLVFQFKLVAVKTVGWAHDDESPKETVTFEYGGLLVKYGQQNSNGQIAGVIPGGWNRVKNKADTDANALIT